MGGTVLKGRIPLRNFVYTNFQTAYQCVLTDIFVEKSLLQVWAYPVFMRHDFMNTFMIYAFTTLRKYIGFQLVLPRTSD